MAPVSWLLGEHGLAVEPNGMFCSLEARFWPTGLDSDRSLDTSAFVGTNPTDERITSGLPVIRPFEIHRAG